MKTVLDAFLAFLVIALALTMGNLAYSKRSLVPEGNLAAAAGDMPGQTWGSIYRGVPAGRFESELLIRTRSKSSPLEHSGYGNQGSADILSAESEELGSVAFSAQPGQSAARSSEVKRNLPSMARHSASR